MRINVFYKDEHCMYFFYTYAFIFKTINRINRTLLFVLILDL